VLDPSLFDAALEHIMKLMFENGYLEFRQTQYFAEWLEEVEKKKPEEMRRKWYKKHGTGEDLPKVARDETFANSPPAYNRSLTYEAFRKKHPLT
jgi:hypothetical protein